MAYLWHGTSRVRLVDSVEATPHNMTRLLQLGVPFWLSVLCAQQHLQHRELVVRPFLAVTSGSTNYRFISLS